MWGIIFYSPIGNKVYFGWINEKELDIETKEGLIYVSKVPIEKLSSINFNKPISGVVINSFLERLALNESIGLVLLDNEDEDIIPVFIFPDNQNGHHLYEFAKDFIYFLATYDSSPYYSTFLEAITKWPLAILDI